MPTVWAIRTVDQAGDWADLVFPDFKRDEALNCLMSIANAPDVTFVSFAKRLMETGERLQ